LRVHQKDWGKVVNWALRLSANAAGRSAYIWFTKALLRLRREEKFSAA
jgi:hypothetical protein